MTTVVFLEEKNFLRRTAKKLRNKKRKKIQSRKFVITE